MVLDSTLGWRWADAVAALLIAALVIHAALAPGDRSHALRLESALQELDADIGFASPM
jgi:divalent metal cation (Fe/Co/Zn/Cd) transporter